MEKDDIAEPTGTLLTIPLRNLGRRDLAMAGGKGANLGKLIRGGFPVPQGFVVTTATYDRFVAHNSLGNAIANTLGEPQSDGTEIRAAFEQAPIPADIAQVIITAYQELGQGAVAVRSSATSEDLAEAAFAGQQDTFLNIVGEEALLDAVRRCWASLWTDRAIAYRDRQGIDQQTVKLAIVVQRMVEAEVAGVLFTANPVTGARDEIVIDANPGLGEAVVSGMVTPDHFVLRKTKSGWSITVRRPGRREVVVRAREGGGTEYDESVVAGSTPVLSDDELLRLTRLGAAIEQHFGSPQDIEWALADDRFYIVQARPITALPEPLPEPSLPVKLISSVFAEMFPIRPYPLDMVTWVPAIFAAVEPLFPLIGIAIPPIEHFFIQDDYVVSRLNERIAPRPTPRILLAPLRLLRLSRRYDPARWELDPILIRVRARVRELESRNLHELSWNDLMVTVRQTLPLTGPLAGEIRRRYFPRALLSAAFLRIILALLRRGHLFIALLSGGESTTSQANRALEVLAGRVRSEPVLADLFGSHQADELRAVLEAHPEGRSFLGEFDKFIDRYGHREMLLSTALEPTWKDAPDLVFGIIKGLATAEARETSEKQAWEIARGELLSHPVLRLAPLRSLVLRVLGTARYLLPLRESTHFEATRILPVLRRTMLELGRRLAEAGVIDAPEDVFHLTLGDLERFGKEWPPSQALAKELGHTVMRRKERRASLEGKPVVDPRLYRPPEPSGDALLSGTPGSPGVSEGPARVIHDASEFGLLRKGEVLVAPYTNPAWTPLFQRAIAVVVDGGAAGSHAAIVAREYGIPAVMGTVEGTRRLTDGQHVRVDGDRGLVFAVSALTTSQHGGTYEASALTPVS